MADVPVTMPTTTPVNPGTDADLKAQLAKAVVLIKQQGEELKKFYGETGAEAGIRFLDSSVKSIIDKVASFEKSISLEKLFNMDTDKMQQTLFKGVESMTKSLSGMALKVGVDIDDKKIDGAFSSVIAGLANTEALAQAGLYATLSTMADQVKNNPILELFKGIEDRALAIDKQGLENFGNRLNFSNITNASASLDGLNKAYRDQLQSLASLGLALDGPGGAKEALKSLGNGAGLTLDEIQRLGAGVFDAGHKLDGMAGFQRILSATGMEAGVAASLLQLQMRSLGVEAGRSLEIFDTLSKVQEGTSVNIDEIGKNVTSAATKFKFYGDNIDGVATIYKQLLKGLGEGKQALAADIFEKVTSGIAGMSTEMKAFIGLTTSLGGGGGGLESALRIEEAISSGKGLDDVMSSIYKRVEDISGAQLLTRQQALDTGQSQQYMIQRNLLSQFTGVQDSQAVEQMVRARQGGGAQVTVDQLRPGADFAEKTKGVSEMTLNQQIGPATRFQQQISGTAELEGTKEISRTLLRIGHGITPAGDEMVNAIRSVSANISEAARHGFSIKQVLTQGVPRNLGEHGAQAAHEKDQVNAVKMGTNIGAQAGDVLKFLGAAQAAERGQEALQQQASYTSVTEKTKLNPTQANSGEAQVSTLVGAPLEAARPKSSTLLEQAQTQPTANMNVLLGRDNDYMKNMVDRATPDNKARPILSTPAWSAPKKLNDNIDTIMSQDKRATEEAAATQTHKAPSKNNALNVPVNFMVTLKNNTVTVEPGEQTVQVNRNEAPYQ